MDSSHRILWFEACGLEIGRGGFFGEGGEESESFGVAAATFCYPEYCK